MAMRIFYDRLIALVFVLGLLAAGAGFAHAGPYEDALEKFTTDDYADTADAITAVATSGSPLAAPLIEALQDGRLLGSVKDKKVFIKTKDGKLIDAATGKPVDGTGPDDIDVVRVNNRLRGVIDAAQGALTLMAPDPAKRYDAAQAVFKSRDEAVLPAVDKALASETNSRVKRALNEARAAIILTSDASSAVDKVAAIAVIRDRGDQDALGLIDGLAPNQPDDVRIAAA